VSKQNQIIIAIAAVVLVGIIVLMGARQTADEPAINTSGGGETEAAQDIQDIGAGDPVAAQNEDLGALDTPNPLGEIALGEADAPVTIVEYSSLTCPHCGAFHRETLPALTEKYIDKGLVKIHFRPFPFDPYATAGAMLAHCVGPAARVSFLDILFKRQQQWIQAEQPMTALQALAQQAGLSESDFVVCLKDQNRLDGIRQMQTRAAEELGVRSTPTFFINGDKLEGNQPLAAFEKLIKPILADARGTQ
jgi:protein-disulfide isomerase